MGVLLSPFAPYALGAAVLVVGFAGVQTWRIGNLKNDINIAEGKIQALTKANSLLQTKREDERVEAQGSFNDLSARCTADMLSSLKTGRLIERVINAPAPTNGSRGRISASSVREILDPAEPVGETGPVSR